METELLPRECTYKHWSDTVKHDENSERPIQVIQISEDTLRTIIQESVQEFTTRMGIQWNDPTEMQKDFAHLREWRETTESLKRKSLGVIVVSLVTGLIALTIIGIKGWFHSSGV